MGRLVSIGGNPTDATFRTRPTHRAPLRTPPPATDSVADVKDDADMPDTMDATAHRACSAWASLVGASASALLEKGVTVVARSDDRPSLGWFQVVGTVLTAPPHLVGELRGLGKRAAKLDNVQAALGTRLGVVTGPARIAWLPEDWDAGEAADRLSREITIVAPTDTRIDAFHRRLPPMDQEEWLVTANHAHTLIRGGRVVAAALTSDIGDTLAHLGVATATDHRLQGHATLVTMAACRDALAEGRVPQFRARERNRGSWRVAAHVGFTPQATQALIGLRPVE